MGSGNAATSGMPLSFTGVTDFSAPAPRGPMPRPSSGSDSGSRPGHAANPPAGSRSGAQSGAQPGLQPGDEIFQGTLETVTYHDEKSLYGVLRLAPDAGFKAPDEGSLFSPGRVTAVGKIADPIEGVRLKLIGRWGRHSSHGVQF